MSQLRIRRYRPGDEVQIRDLLTRIRGGEAAACHKSLELMRWQWLHAPGGPMDSWVIENEETDGSWKIVGHHGLCPVRFTFADEDLLCAKTTNTMLAPEFRSRFLYLRFEQECLKQTDERFDATYSCAPGTARLRSQLGYVNGCHWVHLARGLQSPEMISRTLGLAASRYPCFSWREIKRATLWLSSPVAFKSRLPLQEHGSIEASESRFFTDFWSSARRSAGMAPRRDVADLAWRFWQRPDSKYSTLTCSWEGGARGYCVINIADLLVFRLEDIFIVPSRVDLLEAFIGAVFEWCASQGALLLRFSTTTDGQPEELLNVFARHMHLPLFRHFRPPTEFPRRFSPRGKSKIGNTSLSWNATLVLRPA